MTRHAFLVYANRSGSTLLAAQLSNRIAPEQMLVVPEFRLLEYLFHIGDAKARVLSPSAIALMIEDDHQVEANLGVSRDELMATLQGTIGQGIRVKLEKVLQAYRAKNGLSPEPEVVLWKWGNAATYVHEIGKLFPEAKFVHAVRDGRAVVNSLLRSESPYFAGEDLARGSTLHAVHHWKSALRRNTRPRRVGLELLEVRFGDLVEAPKEVCDSVENFLGLTGEPSKQQNDSTFKVSGTEERIHRLVKENPRSERIDGWQAELAEWRCFVVEHDAGRELEAWAYELRPIDVSLVRRFTWLSRAQIERLVGSLMWAIRRARRYGARLTFRLVSLRIKAWLASRDTEVDRSFSMNTSD